MDQRRFKEYKGIIEESLRLANLTDRVFMQISPINDNAIFLSTSRMRECVIMADGNVLSVLQGVRHSDEGTITFETKDIVNLTNPDSIMALGVAIKDLLKFRYV